MNLQKKINVPERIQRKNAVIKKECHTVIYAEKDIALVPISNRAFSKENKYSLLFPQGPFAVAICLNKVKKMLIKQMKI